MARRRNLIQIEISDRTDTSNGPDHARCEPAHSANGDLAGTSPKWIVFQPIRIACSSPESRCRSPRFLPLLPRALPRSPSARPARQRLDQPSAKLFPSVLQQHVADVQLPDLIDGKRVIASALHVRINPRSRSSLDNLNRLVDCRSRDSNAMAR